MRETMRPWNGFPFCAYFHVILELRQYKNGFVSGKRMSVLKLPPFFPCRVSEGKSAAISKQTCVSQKRARSYIVLALVKAENKMKHYLWVIFKDNCNVHINNDKKTEYKVNYNINDPSVIVSTISRATDALVSFFAVLIIGYGHKSFSPTSWSTNLE